MRGMTRVWGLSLLFGACDANEILEADGQPPADPAEVDADDDPSPVDAPDPLAAEAQDPEEAGLLCVLCVLGGNKPVCGDDNVTYGNACWAACDHAEVVHAGACACGDGHALGEEACDDGNSANDDACTNACEAAACGDGFVQAGEACDDGNSASDDACTNACAAAACGDGFVQAGEDCDDGDASDADACTSECSAQAVLDVAAGLDYTCALLSGGRVKCWGASLYTGLGVAEDLGDEPGEMGDDLPFVDLGPGQVATDLSAGIGHTCALLAGGRVKCWGENGEGELGLGDTQPRGQQPGDMGDELPFVELGAGRTVTAISTGNTTTCALLDGGDIKCFGRNGAGQLGLGDKEARGDEPGEMGDDLPVVDLGAAAEAVAVSAGMNHVCALLGSGDIKCWGEGSGGALGQGDTDDRGGAPGQMGDALPVVPLAGPAIAVASGHQFSCAILADSRVQCWGRNGYGELGAGDKQSRGDQPNEMGANLPFVDLGSDGAADQISASVTGACVRRVSGRTSCWGENAYGVLGVGDHNHRGDQPGEMGDALPVVELGAGLSAVALSRSYLHACAALSDGSAKCWGFNTSGDLGLGDTSNRGDAPGEMGDALPRIRLFSDMW